MPTYDERRKAAIRAERDAFNRVFGLQPLKWHPGTHAAWERADAEWRRLHEEMLRVLAADPDRDTAPEVVGGGLSPEVAKEIRYESGAYDAKEEYGGTQ